MTDARSEHLHEEHAKSGSIALSEIPLRTKSIQEARFRIASWLFWLFGFSITLFVTSYVVLESLGRDHEPIKQMFTQVITALTSFIGGALAHYFQSDTRRSGASRD